MKFFSAAPWFACAGFAAFALRPGLIEPGLIEPGLVDPGMQDSPAFGGPTIVPTAFGSSDSNGSMIAVTGPDVTGGGVLYVIDTERRQLACYQATGGSSSAGLRFLGARDIDLDLQVKSYNDDSKMSVTQLEQEFGRLQPSGD